MSDLPPLYPFISGQRIPHVTLVIISEEGEEVHRYNLKNLRVRDVHVDPLPGRQKQPEVTCRVTTHLDFRQSEDFKDG
jgi:hypothetical protein